MKDGHIKCFRCYGRKKLYKINAGYSLLNIGGDLTDCPLCLGVGTIKKPEFIDEKNDNSINDKIINSVEKECDKISSSIRGVSENIEKAKEEKAKRKYNKKVSDE